MSREYADQSVGCILCLLPPLTAVLLLAFGVGWIGALLLSAIVAAIVFPLARQIQDANDAGQDDS